MKNLEFTQEQYQTLLELVYMGEYVVGAHTATPIEPYNKLKNELFTKAEEFGLKHLTCDEDSSFPKGEFEFKLIHNFVDQYDELTFWSVLTQKLTYRELEKRFTSKEIEAMDLKTRYRTIGDIEREVEEHLKNNGIDQITIT